jgi:hypothetical protein
MPYHIIFHQKYDSTSLLEAPTPGSGVKGRPHMDREVQTEKLVLDRGQCDLIQQQWSNYISGCGFIGSIHAITNQD